MISFREIRIKPVKIMTVTTEILGHSQRKDRYFAHLPQCVHITNHKNVYSVVWCVRFSQVGVQTACILPLQLQFVR